uniref:Uncharacterized protein n=1 Tax=Arundo donax TaxID=35708 RepID=A0A0A9DEB3_ARUDO
MPDVRAARQPAEQASQGLLRRREGRAGQPCHRRLPLRRLRPGLRRPDQPHPRCRAARRVRRRPGRLQQMQHQSARRPYRSACTIFRIWTGRRQPRLIEVSGCQIADLGRRRRSRSGSASAVLLLPLKICQMI